MCIANDDGSPNEEAAYIELIRRGYTPFMIATMLEAESRRLVPENSRPLANRITLPPKPNHEP